MTKIRASGWIELSIWIALFVVVFANHSADANLLVAMPVILGLIALRLIASVIFGACASVWRGLFGR